MAQYNFTGATDGITDRQLEFIYKVIVDNGFEQSKVSFSPVGKAGDNYVANVKRITIESENGSLTLIVKIAASVEAIRQMTQTQILFRNEHIMYTEVLPKFVQLQKNADIPVEDHLKYAKCYGSFQEAPHEVIILEDLKASDFLMLDRFLSLSNDCVRSVLKNFAVFHSLSYVLKLKEPDTYETYKLDLVDNIPLAAGTELMKMFLQGIEDDTLAVFEGTKHAHIIRNKIANGQHLAMKLAKIDYPSKYNVIQQGDAWTNNFMFRFEDDKLKESLMIDYQMSKHSNPVCDILYMIFNCTDYDTRKKDYYNWIDYYHSELDKSLSNFGLKANFVYSRDKLDADLKRYGKLMFSVALIIANMMIRNSEDAEKIMDILKSENGMEDTQQFSITKANKETKTLFKEKVVGLVNSCTEFGLI